MVKSDGSEVAEKQQKLQTVLWIGQQIDPQLVGPIRLWPDRSRRALIGLWTDQAIGGSVHRPIPLSFLPNSVAS